jgi:hypothetical protein
MSGVSNIGYFLEVFGPHGRNVTLAGLYDSAQANDVQRGLTRSGLGTNPSHTDMEALGFFMCVEDLEDELIRHVGADGVLRVIDQEQELTSFRVFQRQPAQRGRSIERQLRRFIGTRSGRKARYGRLLVEALDSNHVPPPLDHVLAYLSQVR